ncbi:hypothetical protein RLEG12_04485 (plasmid) [Rhizobium leguminosarum bv. trifolii CB782]|nr:hypothetical protein RLEG12_04485 [Rhizobium leguminosarum bv. trifolii CB782]
MRSVMPLDAKVEIRAPSGVAAIEGFLKLA